MAKRGGTSIGGSGISVRIEMRHPDFEKATIDSALRARARVDVAKLVVSRIMPQIPIRTGQLRASYSQAAGLGKVQPLRTGRYDSYLNNYDLAEILNDRGYLNIIVSQNLKRDAARVAKKRLRSGGKTSPLKFHGMKVLR